MPTPKPKTLTPRQQAFVREYLIDLNATQAATRAGYSAKTAEQQGARLLGYAKVATAIQSAKKARAERTDVTADRVVLELARVAFGDPRNVMTWGPSGVILKDSADLTDDQVALVAEVSQTTTKDGGSIRAKTNDKLKALELLGKHLGMFVDRQEMTGKDGKPIEMSAAVSIFELPSNGR